MGQEENDALAQAIARVEGRFGTHVLAHGAVAERRAGERRIRTDSSLDTLTPGLATGAPLAFVGTGSTGKVALAHRAAAGAQRDGGTVLWIDPTATFDPLAAVRAGVDLTRLFVVRATTRDDVLLAAGAALRSDGFRLAVVDTGPQLAAGMRIDDLAPLLPMVRSSPAALLVISDVRALRLAIPTFSVARVAWRERFGRTTGWTSLVAERALFHFAALGGESRDLGIRGGLL
ncbi:MAG: recombination protein RecA, partial [Chloroflexota bacterium]|nr:recombination protein RecA [Chloroflexota bacterium]